MAESNKTTTKSDQQTNFQFGGISGHCENSNKVSSDGKNYSVSTKTELNAILGRPPGADLKITGNVHVCYIGNHLDTSSESTIEVKDLSIDDVLGQDETGTAQTNAEPTPTGKYKNVNFVTQSKSFPEGRMIRYRHSGTAQVELKIFKGNQKNVRITGNSVYQPSLEKGVLIINELDNACIKIPKGKKYKIECELANGKVYGAIGDLEGSIEVGTGIVKLDLHHPMEINAAERLTNKPVVLGMIDKGGGRYHPTEGFRHSQKSLDITAQNGAIFVEYYPPKE